MNNNLYPLPTKEILQQFEETNIPTAIILTIIIPYFNVPDTPESLVREIYPEFPVYVEAKLADDFSRLGEFIVDNAPPLKKYQVSLYNYWYDIIRYNKFKLPSQCRLGTGPGTVFI